jgi:hypothetical protein
MSWIVLAAGLGVANFIAVALLFRRLRGDLNRQLRDMRAERNSELILHALRAVPEEQEQAAQVANGSGEIEPSPGGPQPVRRKRHLGLFIGGGIAALVVTLSQVLREAWQTRRGQMVGTAVGVAAAAATTVALLAYQPWEDGDGHSPPSSAPTAVPPAPLPPGYTQPPPNSPQPSGATPSVSPTPSRSGPAPDDSATPGESASTRPPATTSQQVPSVESSGRPAAPPPPPRQPPPDDEPPPVGEPPSTAPEPPPATPTTPPSGKQPPPPHAPTHCPGLVIAPVLSVGLCLLGGGGG